MGQSTETLIRPVASRYLSEPMPGLLSRPEPHSFPAGVGALEEVGVPFQPIPLVGTVIELLDRAAEAMDTDHSVAKICIARASALLQKDHHRAKQECRGTSTTFARGGLAPWQIRQVTRHIDTTLATISTDECAAIVRLSNSHFRRAFKVSFGMTFYRYVYQRRVERAQELMVMTDQSLCQIARRCGFADQSHFARVFRRFVGPSPAVWRRL
jgi:AraC family transcriptional regulator